MKRATILSSLLLPVFCFACSSSKGNGAAYQYGEKEMMEKFWETKTVHNEMLCLVEGEDGSISGNLFYEPKTVISVRDYTLEKEYQEGVDYTVSGNRIVRTPESSIPYFTKENMQGKGFDEGSGISVYQAKEGNIPFTEGIGIVMRSIAVTYQHEDAWEYEIPTYLGKKLPRSEKALKEGGALSILFYGDSIMTGCNTSGKLGVAPFQETYPEMVTHALQKRHPSTAITMQNHSVGGWLSKDGVSNIDASVNAYSPDLVFLGFGMNDGTMGVSVEDYIDHMSFMARSIRAMTPTAEVVFVSTILANPLSIQAAGQENYLAPLQQLAEELGEGVACLDMTTYSKHLNERKRGVDLYANGINHPNDFLARQYVANLLAALEEGF